MADASALAGLLDRAGKVFSLANRLGGAFKEDFDSRGRVVTIGEPSPRQRHGASINEFIAAVLDLSDAVKNPPDGFVAVADQIRKAGKIAKQLAETNSGDILGLFPDLNTVVENGYQAVKAARNATRPDDPFAVFDEPNSAEASGAVEASANVPTLNEIRAKVQATRVRTRYPNASNNPSRMAADAYNDFATIVRMLNKRGIPAPALPDHRLHPLQTMNYVLQKLDDVELALNRKAAEQAGDARSAGQHFVKRLQEDPEFRAGFERGTAKLRAFGVATKLIGQSAKLPSFGSAIFAAGEAVDAELRPVFAKYRAEIDRLWKEYRDVTQRMESEWETEFSEPYPKDVDDWMRWAARIGWSGERITEGNWTLADLFPIIEGYLLRLRDQQATKATPTESPTDSTPKRRGRKKADAATIQREAAMAAKWERARDAGVYKPQFAKDNGMTVNKLDALLDRVVKRKRNSE